MLLLQRPTAAAFLLCLCCLTALPPMARASVVLSPGQPLERAMVEAIVRDGLADHGLVGPLALQVDRPDLPLANQAGLPITLTLVALRHEPEAGRYEARIEARIDGGSSRTITVSGMVAELVEVPVPRASIRQGASISAELLETRTIPASALRATDLVQSADALIGQEALRSLTAGRPVRVRDVAPPALVRRGDQVRLVYARGGLEITTLGVALEAGRQGAPIQIQNGGSGQVRRGVVDGPRRVLMEPGVAP
jgi:flagella basal body P-ring formation protein FlgA